MMRDVMNLPGTSLGRDVLARYLRGRDVSCPRCSHNLRDVAGDVCPGCGEELRLGVGLVDAYLRAWVALAVGLFVPAGVGVFCVIIVADSGWPPARMYPITLSLLYFMGCVPLAVWAAAGRRRFLRMSRAAQRGWAVAACAATAAVGVMFFLGIYR